MRLRQKWVDTGCSWQPEERAGGRGHHVCATDRAEALCLPRSWKESWKGHPSMCERWLDIGTICVQGHLRMYSHLRTSLDKAAIHKQSVREEERLPEGSE